MRLNKFIQNALRISRRKADALIKEEGVEINGDIVHEPFYQVKDSDTVKYKGKVLSLHHNREVFIYYKPRGVVSTLYDRHAALTIKSALNLKEGFKFAGRLDKDSEGLMIITNDGELIYRLTHPSFETKKGYLVWTERNFTQKEIESILKGINDSGEFLKPDRVKKIKDRLYLFVLHEGKKREIRRIVKRFNNKVLRLKRIFMGEFNLPEDMKPGELRKVE